jgi:tryptophan synthase beta chain
MKFPDKSGHFGEYGGQYVPETLMSALEELEIVFSKARKNKKFKEIKGN